MASPSKLRALAGPAALALILVVALYLVMRVYATGELLLAGTMLVIVALAAWIYTSRTTYAFRYLFPGIAAALIFVVFPMVYTIAIGFTNYSSRNLLDFHRAEQYFLTETYRAEGSTYEFTLHGAGNAYRLKLAQSDTDKAFLVGSLALAAEKPLEVPAVPQDASVPLGDPLPLKDVIAKQKLVKALIVVLPDGSRVQMAGLREFAPVRPLYVRNDDGSLKNQENGNLIRPDMKSGYFVDANGEKLQPGFQVETGWDNYQRIFTEQKFREPFIRIFVWTVVFSALTVLFATSLGMLLAVLLNWDALRFKGGYRILLFLPYAVPGFISILVFKGLFNQNVGEINLILGALFGIKPAWFSDPLLAKTMLLIKAIPADLYEASAVAGAGPLTNFTKITLPLIMKPLTPLLISSFAFNFNNFVLISLLTGGRPDFIDTTVPAGTTDLLVSYTYRIAFQDSGANYGLAAAISTVIFVMVAVVSLIQMRFTRIVADDAR